MLAELESKRFFRGMDGSQGRLRRLKDWYLIQYEDGDEEEILFDDPCFNDMVSDSSSVPETRLDSLFRSPKSGIIFLDTAGLRARSLLSMECTMSDTRTMTRRSTSTIVPTFV